MTAPIVWAPAADALEAALRGFDPGDPEGSAGAGFLTTLRAAGAAYDACFATTQTFVGATSEQVAIAVAQRATWDAQATKILRWVDAATRETSSVVAYNPGTSWASSLDANVLSDRYEKLRAFAPSNPFLVAILLPAGHALPSATGGPSVPALGSLVATRKTTVTQSVADAAATALTAALLNANDFRAMLALQQGTP